MATYGIIFIGAIAVAIVAALIAAVCFLKMRHDARPFELLLMGVAALLLAAITGFVAWSLYRASLFASGG